MKNLIKFNESSKFFEIKSLVDNLKDMLVELNDANISYKIEPSNEIRIKFVSLGKDGYFAVFLKDLESKKDSYNLIIENIKMIIDYMDGNGFDTTLTAKYNMNKDTYSGVVTMDRLIKELNSLKPVYWIQLDFIMKNKPVLECLPNEKSIKQLEMVAKLSKKTDIGNRISDMNKEGSNIHWIQNPIETGIESFEDYERTKKAKHLKHIKQFNESKKNNIPRISIPEFDTFCGNNLAFLIDEGYKTMSEYTYDDEYGYLLEFTFSKGYDTTTYLNIEFNWSDIKSDFIPFVFMLNESYNLVSYGGDNKYDKVYIKSNGDDVSNYYEIDELDDIDEIEKIHSIEILIINKK